MVTDPCKQKEPRVIDNAMLERLIGEQGPKDEAGRLARKEGVPFDAVESIRLEYLNILRLDHLWVLKKLKVLIINNNFIEKIENLETLDSLTELDLSFNKIKKIENLDKLVNLEKLSFFTNQITKIENMNTLKKLQIFSIGNNQIADTESVLYLRRFQLLRSLNMAGNPCAGSDFRLYVAAFLSQIVYYEYRLITEAECQRGAETFSKELYSLEKNEGEERLVREEKERIEAEAEIHSKSFVEYLNGDYLFKSLFEEDFEGKAFLLIGEEIEEFYNEYKNNCTEQCINIFNMGQQQYNIRQTEIDQFIKCMEEAQSKNQKESIEFMEEFLVKKAKMFFDIKKLREMLDNMDISLDIYNRNVENYSFEYNNIMNETWKNLMKIELELHEQMEEVNETFGHTITDMMNAFIESAQGMFTHIRSQEVNYNELISEAVGRYNTNLTISGDEITVPPILKPILIDKESIHNALSTSHDCHMQIIDQREDLLLNRAKNWMEKFVSNLETDEISRNRSKVLEINHFLDVQKDEFKELSTDVYHQIVAQDLTED